MLYLTSAARFHYEADCTGDSVSFTFPGDNQCVCCDPGYAKSFYWADNPGEFYYAVAYKEGANSCSGTERCNLNAIQGNTCCNSPNKDIKGAERYEIPMGEERCEKPQTLPPKMARDAKASEGSYEGCVSVWEHGGVLSVAVGDRRIDVPNQNSTRPTEKEVRDALVNAGVEDVEVHVARVGVRLDF